MEIQEEDLSTVSVSPIRDPFTSKNISILDTDHILNSVKEKIREGSTIRRHAVFPFAKGNAFAAIHVLRELYEPDAFNHRHKWDKLAEQSIAEGWARPPEVFQNFFEREYLPSITFVNMGAMYAGTGIVEQVRLRDKSDVPTAQLKVLLARLNPAVFARDNALSKTGVAVAPTRMPVVAKAGRQIDEGVSTIHGVSYFGAAIVLVLDAMALKVASVLDLPKWVTRLVAIAGLGAAITTPERRSKIAKSFQPIVEGVQKVIAEALEASIVLAAEVIPLDSRDGIEQRIAETFVRYGNEDGMLAKEIRAGLRAASPHLILPSISELRTIVSNTPCFGERRPYRYWFLGDLASE